VPTWDLLAEPSSPLLEERIMQRTVLALMAHPDDAEMLCAGTLIRLKREHGWEVHIATMTAGDCGSAELGPEEIARIRRGEGAAAAAVIGAHYHCLEERDLLVDYTPAALHKTVELLCAVRPQIILTHTPGDYHLDHDMTSLLARAAAFAAPIPNFMHGQRQHPPLDRIPHLYYCDPVEGKDAFGQPVPVGFCIDISSVIDTKAEMLQQHHSQRQWLIKHHGMDDFADEMRKHSGRRGHECGVAYAEGYRQHRGHSFPQDNLLGSLLGELKPA
jgi:LmbE family N-acetylglucosaminyl deacetylase